MKLLGLRGFFQGLGPTAVKDWGYLKAMCEMIDAFGEQTRDSC